MEPVVGEGTSRAACLGLAECQSHDCWHQYPSTFRHKELHWVQSGRTRKRGLIGGLSLVT